MLELQEETIVVKIKGVEYSLESPSAGAIEDMESAIQESGAQFKAILDFVVSLGLPKKIARSLTVNQLRQLIEFAAGTKKN